MSDKAQWLRDQLSSASSEVGKWDQQKRETLRSEVSSRLKGSRSDRSDADNVRQSGSDAKPPKG